MIKCVFDNHHVIGKRREMSTQSLPAASLRTGDRLPARRVFHRVSMYLIWMALSSIYWSIRGAVSIFLPEAGRPGLPRLGLSGLATEFAEPDSRAEAREVSRRRDGSTGSRPAAPHRSPQRRDRGGRRRAARRRPAVPPGCPIRNARGSPGWLPTGAGGRGQHAAPWGG